MDTSPETTADPVKTGSERRIKDVTRDGYLVCIEAMRAWAVRKRTFDPEEIPVVTALDLVQDTMAREELSPRSKNAYRAALLWRLRQQTRLDTVDKEALALLEKWAPWALPKPKLRPRAIRLADVETLNDELLNQGSQGGKWALRTSYWLQAGLATGLRPREWLHATWADEEKTSLHVMCGKTKLSTPAFLQNSVRFDQRAEPFGTGVIERTIPVGKDFDRMVIDAHMQSIRSTIDFAATPAEQDKQFARYYNQCRICLHRTCHKLWKGRKGYSLYTMRSQFSANTKAALGSGAAATLMGHSSADSPSAAYYGKASQAHTRSTRPPEFSGLQDKPSLSEISGTDGAPAQTD